MSYEELGVWQRAMEIAKDAHLAVASPTLADHEPDPIVAELMDAAIKIPSRLAMGHEEGPAGFQEALHEVRGLLARLATILEIGQDVDLLKDVGGLRSRVDALYDEVGDMIEKGEGRIVQEINAIFEGSEDEGFDR
jgi:hypothetical protein